jgi:anti-sigma-K factor RskA
MPEERSTQRGHLDDLEIAAYLDGTLDAGERQLAESHLSSCDLCRGEIIASQEAVASVPRKAERSRLSWRPLAGVAAAAAVIVVAASTMIDRSGGEPSVVRADSANLDPRVQVETVSPDNGALLAERRELAWRGQGTGTTYRVTIGDDTGQPIHSASVADTTLMIPATVQLVSGRRYFWYVDAITSDGTTATSGLKSFTVK